ncbi:MAG: nuclear transport factor 2 family protein [Thermoanaerobaculia bacterium]|jgi:hypothetical protein
MNTVANFEKQLNEMILGGKAMDAFEQFYASDIVMQDNEDAPFVGKAFNREREEKFFASIGEVHQLSLEKSAAGDDVSFSEWTYDVTFKGGPRVKWSQAAVRSWKDGKISNERFYHKTLG